MLAIFLATRIYCTARGILPCFHFYLFIFFLGDCDLNVKIQLAAKLKLKKNFMASWPLFLTYVDILYNAAAA